MVAKKRHPGKRLQLFQLSRSRGQHFLAHLSGPGGSGQRQTEGATGGQGRHLPSWGLFHTGEDTWRARRGWAVASNPAPMDGSRKTLSCRTNKREPSRSGFSGFLLFCSASLEPAAARLSGLEDLSSFLWPFGSAPLAFLVIPRAPVDVPLARPRVFLPILPTGPHTHPH